MKNTSTIRFAKLSIISALLAFFIPLRSVAQEQEVKFFFVGGSNGGKEMKDPDNVICFDASYALSISVSGAKGICTWTVAEPSKPYLTYVGTQGKLHDTLVLDFNREAVGNTSRQLSVSVSWETPEGGVETESVGFWASCPAADPGPISVFTRTGGYRIGHDKNKEIYCEGLYYQLKVDKGMDRTYADGAPLQYAWFRVDTIGALKGETLATYRSGDEKYTMDARVSLRDTGRYWMVRARTCDEDGLTANPSFKKIENILRKDIVSDTLRVKHIRYVDQGEQMVWMSIEDTPDKDMENVACVYYKDSVNHTDFSKIYEGNEKGQTGSRPSKNDFESGYIDLEATPFDLSEDIFFPHYRFRWIYDTLDLEIATDKMRAGTHRSEEKGFGPDKARICFRIKERANVTDKEKEEGVNRKKIPVSFEVYCPECEAEAVKNGRIGDDTVYRKKSEVLTLTRVDSLPGELPYTPTVSQGNNSPELIKDNVPEICGKMLTQLCGAVDDKDADYGKLVFVWEILKSTGTWEKADSKEGCVGVMTPEIAQTETHFGDTCMLFVYPRNQCFQNGWKDSKRDTVSIYVKALPPAPSIVDPLDEVYNTTYNRPFSGVKEPEKPDAFEGKTSVLLCNYTEANKNWPIRSYYLISKNSPIKPQKDDGREGGYTLTLPEGFESAISYQITSLDGTTNPNDTNIITFTINGEASRNKLAGQSQLAFGLAAANECGPGSEVYYPVNIIDTLSVYEHIRHTPFDADTTLDSIGWVCEGELWQWSLRGEEVKPRYLWAVKGTDADGVSLGEVRNTDKVEYQWTFDPTWRFSDPLTTKQNPTSVEFGRNSGQVRLALRNRCGTSKARAGDYVNVNPFTRVKIKVTDMTDAATARPAYDPLLAQGALGAASNQEFLVQPCRDTRLVYAADTSYLTEEYLWVFPSDWKVLDEFGYGTATWIGTGDSANFARTKNDSLFDPMRNIDEMRVAVQVGGDTGNIMVIGKKTGCKFFYDNVAGGAAHEELRGGHRADSLHVFVRPFTGKPALEKWPNDLCVRTTQTLVVKPDPKQDKKTQQETYFTWKFPNDWTVTFRNEHKDTVDVVIPNRITEEGVSPLRGDTVMVYSHREDCKETNKGDSTIHVFRLVDTLSLDPESSFRDLLHKGVALNLSPCEGDTVEYALDGSFHEEMDSIVYRWSRAMDLNGTRTFETGDSIDFTGWRVLNAEDSYSSNPVNVTTGLKMVVGRAPMRILAYGAAHCGESSPTKFIDLTPVSLVRDKATWIEGGDLLCEKERAVFRHDTVKYATNYEWHYPWGRFVDTTGKSNRGRRTFSDTTTFAKGNVYVVPYNHCGMGPSSDTITIANIIGHLNAPTAMNAIAQDGVTQNVVLKVLADTAFDTVCLRHNYTYQAAYTDSRYTTSAWKFDWFSLSEPFNDSLAMQPAPADSSEAIFFKYPDTTATSGFDFVNIGVRVRHEKCRRYGDTLTLKILPYDTAVSGVGMDYIVDLETGKADIQTKPCGADTAMWMVNKAKFVPALKDYQFVWGVDPKNPLGRTWSSADKKMNGSAFEWLNGKTEGADLNNFFYAADTLYFAIPNFAEHPDSLYVAVNVRNRCGISHLPSFVVKSEEELTGKDHLRIKPGSNANFCDREKLTFVASVNHHVNSRIWYYPWNMEGDTITGESRLESTTYSDSLQEGYVYFMAVNGCGEAPDYSDSIKIENIKRIPDKPRKPSFDSLCMNQPAWLKAEFPGGTDPAQVEILWRKLSGQAGASIFAPQQNTDSCRLAPTDVKAEPLRISVKSRVKGCNRYSDSLVINITSLDTLAFVIPSQNEEEEEEGETGLVLGKFDLDLTQTLVADGKPVDLTPCADLPLIYGIQVDPAKAWSLDKDFESYLSWNRAGAAPSVKPDTNLRLGGSNWMFNDEKGDTNNVVHYAQLPLLVGASDSLYFHITLKNRCGISHSPGLLIVPDRKVSQKPRINPKPLCLGAEVSLLASNLQDIVETLNWVYPWTPYYKETKKDYPYLDVTVGPDNGNIILWAGNHCEKYAKSDTLKVDAVMKTPQQPVPAWLPEGRPYAWKNADTVVEYICLHGESVLTVKPGPEDGSALKFIWKFMSGANDMTTRRADGASYFVEPSDKVTLNDSALLAVCGNYPSCGNGYYGDTLYIRLRFTDTLPAQNTGIISYAVKGSENRGILCPDAEVLFSVDNQDPKVSYHWNLPGRDTENGWKIKDALTGNPNLSQDLQFPVPGDSNFYSIVAIVGETGGRVSVQVRTSASVLGCPYFSRPVQLEDNFTVRTRPDAPAFTTFVQKPCVAQETEYVIEPVTGARAYRWHLPAGWRFKVNGGTVSQDTIWDVSASETNATRCTVIAGQDTGYIRVWAIDSCNGGPAASLEMSRIAYPLDTARLIVVGGHSACIDSTIDLQVFGVAPYTLFSDVYYTLDVKGPGKNTFNYEGDVSQYLWSVVSHSFDSVYMVFTPVFAACPNNVEPYIHYILADTTPEIKGSITGPDSVCSDNLYEYEFHLSREMGEIDITCTWEISTDAWKIVEMSDDTTVVLHFLGMPVDETTGRWSRETDTLICYPRGMCGTGLPVKLPIALREADPFADSVVVSVVRPCVGTEIEVYLRDSALYNPYPDSIKFVWNTPDNWQRLVWDGEDLSEATDSLPATLYRVQLDTADAVIAVRMWRKGACGLSQTLRSTPVHVRDSAAKASVVASYMLNPCYTRPAYNIVLEPKDDVDSAVWTLPADLKKYSLSTRAVAAFRYDSLWIDNPDQRLTPISLPVRTINECGHRDTVFVVRPITDIEKFTDVLHVPRLCFGDTAYAWITLPKTHIEQGAWYIWNLEDSTHTLLRQWSDSVAAMEYLVSPAGDSVHIQIIAVNDCAADSNQHADTVPYSFRIWPAADPDTALYLQSGVKLLIDSVAPGKKDDYTYAWTPSNRVVDSIPATRTLVQAEETFYVRARQVAAEGAENLPFYRRDRLCVADDSVKIVVDSVFSFVPLDADTICVDLTDSLFAVSFGGNRENYHINWYEYIDDEWDLIPEMKDSALFTPVFITPGTYFYRVVGFDSTILRDEEADTVILVASHYDTLEIAVQVYDLQTYFRNIASDEVEVPMGGRVEVLTRFEDGSGRYHFEWTPESWVSSVDSTDGSMNTVALFREGEMTLTVTDSASGCVRETTVRVKPGKGNNIPNVITPNGDGYNDIFLKGVSRLTIFTSWGEQIFHSEDGNGWDGSRNGQPVRPGEYLYVAEIDGEDGSVRTVKGVVTVKYE